MLAMPSIVTLTTDFGLGSRYVAAMKGALLAAGPALSIIDLSHTIPPQDLLAGARFLAETTPWFPAGTLHLAVIDPGVGTDRRLLYAEIAGQRYVLPDNGLLTCLAERQKPATMRVIENRELWLPSVSPTFHGRDIMAPVAAQLALGLPPEQLGPTCDQFVKLPLPEAKSVGEKNPNEATEVEGEVIEVDSFGNLITNITSDLLQEAPTDDAVRIECDGHETTGLYRTYADQPTMTLIALIGSSGQLELAIVDDSATLMLGVQAGATVRVHW